MEEKKSITPYVIIALAVLLITGGVIWYFSLGTLVFKPPPKEEEITPGSTGFPSTPSVPSRPGETRGLSPEERAKRKLIRLTDFPVASPALSKSGNKVLFYGKSGGDIYESDFLGLEQKKISNITILGITEALWSPRKDKAIVWYLDKEELKNFIQVVATSTQAVFLPQNTQSASWSPDGLSIAYLSPANNRYNLVTADSNNRNQRVRFSTPVQDFSIRWVSQNQIAFSSSPSGLSASVLYVFDLRNGLFSKVLDNRYGFVPLWSPDGKKILFSATNDRGQNPNLYLRRADGTISKLAVQTVPEKCVWTEDSKELFCALPRSISFVDLFPDAYYQGLTSFSDKFSKIEVEKNESTEIFNEEDLDAKNLLLSPDKKFLLFINRKDGALWSLNLEL